MAWLEDFYDYKNQLMKDLLTNEAITRLLQDECGEPSTPKDFMYSQVFPYEYVPDTVEHGRTYICCDVDISRTSNRLMYTPTLYIWIFTHKSKLRLPEGGVRTDKLASEIVETINRSYNYGLGELQFCSSKRFAPVTDYLGKVLTFQAKEWNAPGINTKPVPVNRKGY